MCMYGLVLTNDRASPRLKDASIPAEHMADLYVELLLMTRKMYVECRLVHADLSEYNILYHVDVPPQDDPASGEPSSDPHTPKGHLYLIDVSQSVEHDHPHAFDFLRADLRNVEEFFGRHVRCVGLRRAFGFVTRERLGAGEGTGTREEEEEALLRRWMDERGAGELADDGGDDDDGAWQDGERALAGTSSLAAAAAAAHEDSVFMRSYIPRTLNEVVDPEGDARRLRGDAGIYRDLIVDGYAPEPETARMVRTNGDGGDVGIGIGNGKGGGEARAEGINNGVEEDEEGQDGSSNSQNSGGASGEDDEDGTETGERGTARQPRGHRHEDKEVKKVSVSRCHRRA